MDLSTSKTAEAKKLKTSVENLVFADLLSIGYSEADAYIISHPGDSQMSTQYRDSNMRRITRSSAFRELCEERKRSNTTRLAFSGNLEDVELIDAEETAKEILKIARMMPEHSKERGEMFMKYADLTRKNDAATEESTDAINFYFPIKCDQCPLLTAYNDFLKRNKTKEVRPVEMERIIRLSHSIIKKAIKEESED